MSKLILSDNEAMEKIIKGVNTVANVVKSTLGPKGRNVIIRRNGQSPLITNDGATIAKEISLKDEFEDTGAQLIINASKETNEEAGDGTTTTTIITQKLINKGTELIKEGIDPIDLRAGMNEAVSTLVDKLKEESKEISSTEDITKIATISSGSELIGGLIGEAYDSMGKEGAITVEESKTNTTSIEIKEGYRVPVGLIPAYFERGKDTIDLDDVAIIVTASKIDTLQPFANILNEIGQQGGKAIIFAESITNPVVDALVINHMRGLQVFGVDLSNCPDKLDTLEDIAVATGAKLFNQEKGILHRDITMDDLGMARKAKIKKEKETLLIDCCGTQEAKEERVQQIKAEMENKVAINDSEKTRYTRRISSLNKGIAIINLGSSSEIELGELKLRVEDALCSVKSSLEEGIVAGAGSTFIKLTKDITVKSGSQAFEIGQEIVYDAVKSLLEQILKNADYKQERIDEIISKVRSGGLVYNLVTEDYEDPENTQVFDPTKVERVSLEKSVSIASSILVSSSVIVDEPDNKGDLVLEALGLK